ncbi:error-prone DNA polymerase [Algimonas arctica]|uniref:Error-prone DNA polymerase n=1 Tax=Algimonas arctica TaxID=1479486 RepID=A0A8J3G3J8_9PROT|nr:error-prone DNA polymerase [Algimonas arctica]
MITNGQSQGFSRKVRTELDTISNFTFLTGASHPRELVERAVELGLSSIAIADVNTFAGVVRGFEAALELAEAHSIRFIIATRIVTREGITLLAYPKTKQGYANLCRLLTKGKRATKKGQCDLGIEDLIEWQDKIIWVMRDADSHLDHIAELSDLPDFHLGLAPHFDGQDATRFAAIRELSDQHALPLCALGNVMMHRANRRPLADILSCIRETCTIDQLGRRAQLNAERRLRSPFELKRVFAGYEDALVAAAKVADMSRFSLKELAYQYPDEVMNGEEPQDRLTRLTDEGLRWRYPEGVSLKNQQLVAKELALIAKKNYAAYFLTVEDVVRFARSKGILCQGRGSAANSVVCYALGITEASPETISMVFERFVSEARDEPPDIDVDFEHERREEVIQYLYSKYGRHRAGICSTVIHFRSRSAIRQVGKAMGLSQDAIARLSGTIWGSSNKGVKETDADALGFNQMDRRFKLTLELAAEITGFPRHLSQHVGGFVITQDRLDEMCPVENAAMADRTIIEWDKDDIDVIGMLKIDVLALGMLTAIRKSFRLLSDWKGLHHTIANIPAEDKATYDMICQADTLGVFQIESRAQMNFLPRMRPRTFYDLVVEVAIVRPGPIQGDMIHPYLKRRRGDEPVHYPSKELVPVLEKTLGVPLFQEQAMQIAVVAAGFTPSEADQLRRALGAFRSPGKITDFKDRFISGCLSKGYKKDFAEAVFSQLEGFSGYGFPESHSASFALLVYASCWLKCHHPDVFCCALLNSQPMGFYAPAQIVQDARRHNVEVRPICVENSYWDNILEPGRDGHLAVRLGFRLIKGLRQEDGNWVALARGNGYRSVDAVWRKAGLSKRALSKLSEADAFHRSGLNRREALWAVKGLGGDNPLPLFADHGEGIEDEVINLPLMRASEEVYEDYLATRLTLRDHPMRFLNDALGRTLKSSDLRDAPNGRRITVSGLVVTRQKPGAASGVVFITLEDETGAVNVVVWNKLFQKNRGPVMAGRLLRISGKLQREGIVHHVIAERIEDMSHLLNSLGYQGSRDGIAPTEGNADEAKRPIPAKESARSGGTKRHALDNPKAETRQEREERKFDEARGGPKTVTAYYAAGGGRHPRDQAKALFPSRDFH